MKLNVKALGLAFGILWGIGVFVLTWWIIAFDGPSTEPNLLTQGYRGYSITPIGSVIGLIWGFFDGLVGGILFGWLYNLILGRK
jgi:hypothetical protein